MKAIEQVTSDPSLHPPDLGGTATTDQVTDAVCARITETTGEYLANAPTGRM